jgi:outer membrane receptor protein involved in Fe transport
MSGIVNQITKIPEDHYNGSFSAYTGDYITSRTNLFQYMGGFDPVRTYNVQGSLSGPIPATNNLIKFFTSAKYLNDDGYIYGKRIFNTHDSSNFSSSNPANWYVGATGDGKNVPMQYSHQLSLQGKLEFKVGDGKGIVLEALYQKHDYTQFGPENGHLFLFDPDGNYTYHEDSFLGSISYTHVFNRSSFLDILGSAYTTDYKQYAFENPLDPRYVTTEILNEVGGNALYAGGTQNWYFTHNTKTYTAKADYTNQLTNVHEIKAGFEVDLNSLGYKDFHYNVYNNHPYQLAAYLQDKIEFDYLIINVGVRFDYFQPDGRVLNDPNNIALLDSLSPPYPTALSRKASAKQQISPRIGISYPISEKGAVHISYGHFFQVPPFQYLYANPNFRIPLTGNYPDQVGTSIGDADLKPQETVMYELGLQQEVTDELGVNVTAYYKDIRNLLAAAIHEKNNFKKFAEYINQDYGAVTGFTLSLTKKFIGGIGATLDYTYQVAEGDASDPNQAYTKAQANPPIQLNSQLVPLDWDRRHSINFTLTAGIPDNYIISAVGQLASGEPYTPSFQNQRTGLENSANRPTFFNVDLYITKYFKLSGMNFSVFAKIYNLFDTANELTVYDDTGRAGYTLEETRAQSAPRGINTLQQFFSRPDYYSAPRQVLVGVSMDF